MIRRRTDSGNSSGEDSPPLGHRETDCLSALPQEGVEVLRERVQATGVVPGVVVRPAIRPKRVEEPVV